MNKPGWSLYGRNAFCRSWNLLISIGHLSANIFGRGLFWNGKHWQIPLQAE